MEQIGRRKITRLQFLYFLHEVWTNAHFKCHTAAFRSRAVCLGRIECEIHHLEQQAKVATIRFHLDSLRKNTVL